MFDLAMQLSGTDAGTTVLLSLIEAAKLIALAYIGYKVRYGVAPPPREDPNMGSHRKRK